MSAASLRTCLFTLSLLCLAPAASAGERDDAWTPAPYDLGRGLQIPGQGLTVGGYLSLYYSNLDHRGWLAGLRDLSLFLGKALSARWYLFSEIELGNAVEFSSHGATDRNSEVDLERLYADYRATRNVNVRLGKFLTPVGHWNQIHADPLVWTVDRPLVTAAPFARHATGAQFYGNMDAGGKSLDYSLFVDDSELLDPDQKKELAFEDDVSGISLRNAFDRAAGLSARLHLLDDSLQIGASYLRMTMYQQPARSDLYGLDALWNVGRAEFSSELIYRDNAGASSHDEYGGFVQAVVPLAARLYAIGRYEHYKPGVLPHAADIGEVGLTYRPHDAVSLKLDYREGQHNAVVAPDGWLASLAILF